jgi:CRISPR-associated endonuclease Cas2
MNFLVCYDVPDIYPNVRRKVSQACEDFGLIRIQYSVFWGSMTTAQARELGVRCVKISNNIPIDIRFIAVCSDCFAKSFAVIHNSLLNTYGTSPLNSDPMYSVIGHHDVGWGIPAGVNPPSIPVAVAQIPPPVSFSLQNPSSPQNLPSVNLQKIQVAQNGSNIDDIQNFQYFYNPQHLQDPPRQSPQNPQDPQNLPAVNSIQDVIGEDSVISDASSDVITQDSGEEVSEQSDSAQIERVQSDTYPGSNSLSKPSSNSSSKPISTSVLNPKNKPSFKSGENSASKSGTQSIYGEPSAEDLVKMMGYNDVAQFEKEVNKTMHSKKTKGKRKINGINSGVQAQYEDKNPIPHQHVPIEDMNPSSKQQTPIDDKNPIPHQHELIKNINPNSQQQTPIEAGQLEDNEMRGRIASFDDLDIELGIVTDRNLMEPQFPKMVSKRDQSEFAFQNGLSPNTEEIKGKKGKNMANSKRDTVISKNDTASSKNDTIPIIKGTIHRGSVDVDVFIV